MPQKSAHPATLRTDGPFIAPLPHDGQQLDTGHLKARQHGRFLATLMTTATAVFIRLPAFGTGSCRAVRVRGIDGSVSANIGFLWRALCALAKRSHHDSSHHRNRTQHPVPNRNELLCDCLGLSGDTLEVIRQLGHLGDGQSLLRALSVGERMCLRHGPSGLVVSRVRFASRGYPVGGFFGQVLGWVQLCR